MSNEDKPPSGCLVLFLILYTIISAPIILGLLNFLGIPLIGGNVAVTAAAINKYFSSKNGR